MADYLVVEQGAPPWLPSPQAETVAEFAYHDVPLSGVLRQHGVDFFFSCMDGAAEPVSFWIYRHVTEREWREFQRATSPEAYARMVGQLEFDRPYVIALAVEKVGIVGSRVVTGNDEDELRQACEALVTELETLAGEARALASVE